MSGAKSRRKGATAEREFCALVHEYLGLKVNRNLKQYQQSQLGDIEQLIGPYLIECKSQARVNEKDWWKQACEAARKAGAVPALAMKLSRKGWRVMVPCAQPFDPKVPWHWDYAYTETCQLKAFFYRVGELL